MDIFLLFALYYDYVMVLRMRLSRMNMLLVGDKTIEISYLFCKNVLFKQYLLVDNVKPYQYRHFLLVALVRIITNMQEKDS